MAYRRKDAFYRKAKSAGLRSRAAFKLEDVAGDLLRAGQRVVDLGCWPGGWSQIAARLVGDSGRVVGIDVKPCGPPPGPNVIFLAGDAADAATIPAILARLGGQADVVLSDMAPPLTGIRDRDEVRTAAVSRAALEAARQLLRPGGDFVCKAFVNAAYEDLAAEVRAAFARVRAFRPPSTRKGSAEVYLVARGFRPAGGR